MVQPYELCDSKNTNNGFTPVMAYVPFQEMTTLYCPEEGLRRGTIFPDLDKPLMIGGRMK